MPFNGITQQHAIFKETVGKPGSVRCFFTNGQKMRYFAAIIESLALISVIWILMVGIERCKKHRLRQGFIAAKERGDIPTDADIDSATFGTEVAQIEAVAFGVLGLWMTFRVVLIPLIVAISVTIAWYTSNLVPKN